MSFRHRRCVVLRGSPEATLAEATRLTSRLATFCSLEGTRLPRSKTRQLLGQSFDAVVLDLHRGVAADTLGQAHGLVRGGGALILRMPPEGHALSAAELAVHPFTAADVTTRFWSRLERHLARLDTAPPVEPLVPSPPAPAGNDEQRRVVQTLATAFAERRWLSAALIAERGRGKSSALGLALRAALDAADITAIVTAPSADAAVVLLRFAAAGGERLRFVPAPELLAQSGSADVVVVDEAAQLPVPLLRALVTRNPKATLAFATTTHGYEGTGRGFVLRFLDWLAREPRPHLELTLKEPIRWAAGDPLERFIYDLLALDAGVAPLTPRREDAAPPAPAESSSGAALAPPRERAPRTAGSSPAAGAATRVTPPLTLPEPRRLHPDELARDEPLLRSLFGLLVGAHYKTTPGDLERLLDAPNLAVHASVDGARVLGATLVAREGSLAPEDCRALARGEWRIRGHALPDTLIVHAGLSEAGELAMMRSVRVATHPELRRRGLARALIEHVHACYAPDLFGTIFGATLDLLEFRRALGYAVVRLGSSRGPSSGEPSLVMLRAASPRGHALVHQLRAEHARNLPLQLELLRAESELALDPQLAGALQADAGAAQDLDPAAVRARVERFASGAQTMEGAAYVLAHFISHHGPALARLDPRDRALLERRGLLRDSWQAAAQAAGLPDVPSAMRAFRPALRRLLESCA